jgi:hypothetical protein
MDVQIGTVTSRVTVTDQAAAGAELIDKIVAMVMARLRDEEASRESTRREQEIHHHMTEPPRF